MIVYKITNKINNKVYIGQTKRSLQVRITAHTYSANVKNSQLRLHKAIRKYGIENFIWEAIKTCNSLEELNECEIEQISNHNSFLRGYNMTNGGLSPLGYKHSDGVKTKMTKRVGPMNGHKHTIEAKIQNAVSNGGGKPFIVCDKNNNPVWYGVILSQCAKELKLSVGNISECLHGKRKQHKGYTFEYEIA